MSHFSLLEAYSLIFFQHGGACALRISPNHAREQGSEALCGEGRLRKETVEHEDLSGSYRGLCPSPPFPFPLSLQSPLHAAQSVDAADTGTSIGLSHGVRTLTGVIAPTLGGLLYTNPPAGISPHKWLGLFCAGCCAVSLAFAQFGLKTHPLEREREKVEEAAGAEKKAL